MHNCHMLLFFFFSLDEYINVHCLCKQIEIDEKKKKKPMQLKKFISKHVGAILFEPMIVVIKETVYLQSCDLFK